MEMCIFMLGASLVEMVSTARLWLYSTAWTETCETSVNLLLTGWRRDEVFAIVVLLVDRAETDHLVSSCPAFFHFPYVNTSIDSRKRFSSLPKIRLPVTMFHNLLISERIEWKLILYQLYYSYFQQSRVSLHLIARLVAVQLKLESRSKLGGKCNHHFPSLAKKKKTGGQLLSAI